jgi:hypothetical protein
MYYGDKTDREILLLVADRTEKLENAVVGKNRPGLIEDVAALKQEVDDLKGSTPSGKERWGVIGAVAFGAVAAAARILGVDLQI